MFVACSKEEGINQEEPKTEVETIDFIYKGAKYSTKVTTKGQEVTYSDEAAGELYQKLNELPNLATVVKEDGSIELFDDYSAYEATFKRNDNSKVAKYPKPIESHLFIFQDTRYMGLSKSYSIYGTQGQAFVPNLESVYDPYAQKHWNDAISSLNITFYEAPPYEHKGVLTLFQDFNYNGNSITFEVSTGHPNYYVEYLWDYFMYKSGLKKKYWNDAASSFKYRIEKK